MTAGRSHQLSWGKLSGTREIGTQASPIARTRTWLVGPLIAKIESVHALRLKLAQETIEFLEVNRLDQMAAESCFARTLNVGGLAMASESD